jgi:hypothetical protein
MLVAVAAALLWACVSVPVAAAANAPCPPSTGAGFSCIPYNFNGTTIPSGDYVWFNAVVKLQTYPSCAANPAGFTVYFKSQTINFVNGVSLTPPDSQVTFSCVVGTLATTTFSAGTWQTTIPLNPSSVGTKNAFLAGFSYQAPANLTNSMTNPTWSGTFTVSPGVNVSVNWKWAAAVYTTFNADNNALNVKPTDDNSASVYHNSDHAGTPEAYKNFVIGGAAGGGGSNYTGSYSGTAGVTPPGLVSPVLDTNGSPSVNLGQPINDRAMLTLASTSPPASGTITFTAYGPNDNDCSNGAVFTSTPVAVNGNGTYIGQSFIPGSSGTYFWTASYSGDAYNTPIMTGCGDMGEASVVKHDTAKPTCALTGTTYYPGTTTIQQIQVTVQDSNSGITTIVETHSNATVTPPGTTTFTPATMSAQVVTATKVNQGSGSTLKLTITDTAGNSIVCDPVFGKSARKTAPRHAKGAHVQAAGLTLHLDTTLLTFGSTRSVTFTGTIPDGQAGESVSLLSQACGFTGYTEIAKLKTGAGGSFSYRTQPALGAVFAVRWNGVTSPAVRVSVLPLVTLTRTAAGRYRADVTTTNPVFLAGTKVLLQRANGSRWVTVGSATLRKNSPETEIRVVSTALLAAKSNGAKLRAVVPGTACYAAGVSAAISG